MPHTLFKIELRPIPFLQYNHGHLFQLLVPSSSCEIMTFILCRFTLRSLNDVISHHYLSLASALTSLFAINTKSSAYDTSQRFLNMQSSDKASRTIVNNKGVKTNQITNNYIKFLAQHPTPPYLYDTTCIHCQNFFNQPFFNPKPPHTHLNNSLNNKSKSFSKATTIKYTHNPNLKFAVVKG